MTKEKALQLSKSRLEKLSRTVGHLSYVCYVLEKDCDITDNSESAVVKWISNEISKKGPSPLYYDNNNANFDIDGAIRIAKTGRVWGSPITFNENLLAIEESPGQYKAIGFWEALAILIHEMGHHQDQMLLTVGLPFLNHEDLDIIAAKVVDYLKSRTRTLSLFKDFTPGITEDTFVYIIDYEWYNGIRNLYSYIYLDNGKEVEDISRKVTDSLGCPTAYDKDGRIVFQGEAYQVSMRQVSAPSINAGASYITIDQTVNSASAMCVDTFFNEYQIFDGYTDGHFKLHLDIPADGHPIFNRQQSGFRATTPPDKHYK